MLAPVVAAALFFALPGTMDRVMYGFGKTDVSGQAITDDYEVTSGRTQIWPHVIDKIEESPVIGQGRLGMRRSGVTELLHREYGQFEAFPHPHNMYLELLLDNGVLGAIPVLLFFGFTLVYSAKLFRDADPWCSAAGGLALALTLAQLIAGMGAQHFYPRESTVGMWAGMLLLHRVRLERMRVPLILAGAAPDKCSRQFRMTAFQQLSEG